MNLLRSIIHALWTTLHVVPWAIIMMVASLFVSSTKLYWMAARWLGWVVGSLRLICGVHYRITGMENLPHGEKSPAILLVKHQSTYETFLMPVIMPHPLAYVFKRELIYIPFFGWAMARLDMIHIDRSKRSEAFSLVVEQGKRLLEQGVWIIMFPEGTRIPRGQTGTYKTGGARLAVATGAPVVPIAVNSARHWPRKALVKTPGTVDVVIGKPIPSVGRDPDELMQQVQAWIEGEMRKLDPEAYSNK